MLTKHRFPDFLCIGAQKAGTTWLHNNLQRHPDIGLPNLKELNYFNGKEKVFNQTKLNRILHPHSSKNVKKYLDNWRTSALKNQIKAQLMRGNLIELFTYLDDFYNFSNDKLYSSFLSSIPEKIIGEISPNYSTLSQDSVSHIYRIMPELKIIFILRNPMDRSWSHACMDFRRENINLGSSPDKNFIAHFNSEASRTRSDYLKTLETWQLSYPKEQFLICFFEEIAQDPQDFIRRICEFLNLETDLGYLQKISTKSPKSHAQVYKHNLSQELKVYLAKLYYPELEQLSSRFGGYATEWLDCAKKLLS